jgi:DNA modification methylase
MNDEIRLRQAIHSTEPVGGLTHDFYRYPARFSPEFARAAIEVFTSPGDVVFDPFMGGGTTLVEARALARQGIGTDISSLAAFIARVKTTPLTKTDTTAVRKWARLLGNCLNLHKSGKRSCIPPDRYYQRNISGKSTWAIRKTIRLVLCEVDTLPTTRQRNFARCVLLRTAQWALDCRQDIPTASEMRVRFSEYLEQMLTGAEELRIATRRNLRMAPIASVSTYCLQRSAIGVHAEPKLKRYGQPALILTSPPYPGVHVLYHRWQVLGRKETPAPFWIANSQDGCGASFYTMGDRKQQGLESYYRQIREAFQSVAKLCGWDTTVVQILAFAEPSWQLPEYLEAMERAGFAETTLPKLANAPDGRIWRRVPNRKWYADHKGSTSSSSEVVLFHKLSSQV